MYPSPYHRQAEEILQTSLRTETVIYVHSRANAKVAKKIAITKTENDVYLKAVSDVHYTLSICELINLQIKQLGYYLQTHGLNSQ